VPQPANKRLPVIRGLELDQTVPSYSSVLFEFTVVSVRPPNDNP